MRRRMDAVFENLEDSTTIDEVMEQFPVPRNQARTQTPQILSGRRNVTTANCRAFQRHAQSGIKA